MVAVFIQNLFISIELHGLQFLLRILPLAIEFPSLCLRFLNSLHQFQGFLQRSRFIQCSRVLLAQLVYIAALNVFDLHHGVARLDLTV